MYAPAVTMRRPFPAAALLTRRGAMLARKSGGLGSLGDTCQWPQPGVPMMYPACTAASAPGVVAPDFAAIQKSVAAAYAVDAYLAAKLAGNANYQAPTVIGAYRQIVDPVSGANYFVDANGNRMPDGFNAAAANDVIQQQNQAAGDAANRAVFIQNCELSLVQQNAYNSHLGLPLVPDDCSSRYYGATLPGGTTGGAVDYQPVSTAVIAAQIPAPVVAAPIAPPPITSPAPTPSSPAPAAPPASPLIVSAQPIGGTFNYQAPQGVIQTGGLPPINSSGLLLGTPISQLIGGAFSSAVDALPAGPIQNAAAGAVSAAGQIPTWGWAAIVIGAGYLMFRKGGKRG